MISLLEEILSNPRDANLYFCNGKSRKLEDYFHLPKMLNCSMSSGAQTALGVSKLNQNPLSSPEFKKINKKQLSPPRF